MTMSKEIAKSLQGQKKKPNRDDVKAGRTVFYPLGPAYWFYAKMMGLPYSYSKTKPKTCDVLKTDFMPFERYILNKNKASSRTKPLLLRLLAKAKKYRITRKIRKSFDM